MISIIRIVKIEDTEKKILKITAEFVKFHSYSFNNTLLIAMQGGQLVAGYNKWRDDFHRNVKKGEKAIKILAPAPIQGQKGSAEAGRPGKAGDRQGWKARHRGSGGTGSGL